MALNLTFGRGPAKPRRAQPPKPPSEGGYAEIWGEHIHSVRYFKAAAVFFAALSALLAFGLIRLANQPQPLPIVVRVDEVGRADVVDYDLDRAQPTLEDPVIPYFLTSFVRDHYSRRRVVGVADWRRSLYFMRNDVAAVVVEAERQSFIDFLTNELEPDRIVENVELRMIPQPDPPYVVEIVFDLIDRDREFEVGRTTMIASLRFVFAEELEPETALVNPLGIVIVFLEASTAVQR